MSSGITGSKIDLIESSGADLPAPGTTRIIRAGGVTQQSVDGAPFAALGAAAAASPTWKSAMQAFAQAKYPTLNSDPLFLDVIQGAGGDYTQVFQALNGVINVSTGFRGGVGELDTGVSTASGSHVAMMGKGQPALTNSMTTGAPWFVASRGQTVTGVDATGQSFVVGMTLATATFLNSVLLGCYGPTSTTNYTFYVSGTTQIDTGIPVDLVHFKDFGIGFDGTTLVPYFGDVLAGTFAAIAGKSSTDLTGMTNQPGAPAAAVVAGSTTRIRQEIDKLFGMVAVP